MASIFQNADRVLSAVAALGVFALNDVRMFLQLPRDPGNGQTHALSLQFMGATEQVYVSAFDLAIRWGLVGITVALCIWAVAETLKPAAQQAE
jgi:hypothetical protein